MDGDKFSHEEKGWGRGGAMEVSLEDQWAALALPRLEVVGNLITLFIAGTDTTSALGWAFYSLAFDQELQQRVADEVKDLPDEVSPQQLVTSPQRWDRQCHGMWAELEVCYRHLLKNAPEVKAKLGDDLQHFRPSRWIGPEARSGIVKCPPFDSLAFGHGVRACLGKQLADYEGRLVIAQVLRHFVLEKWTGPPLKERTTFVVAPAEDVKIRLHPRSNA
eukprot:Skav224515  [mRNA]  locus=scaffold4480:6995:11410:+ [translate_table: standard]